MEDSSPHSFELEMFHNLKMTLANDTKPRTKRPLDFQEEDHPLQSAAKKPYQLSHYCSTPRPSEKTPQCSPDSACSLGSSGCLDDTELGKTVIGVRIPEDSALALSLDATRCFDDSDLDDSLLEPSDDEGGSSPFNYTEEQCKEMLADDYLGEQNPISESALVTQGVWEHSKKEVSSNRTWASVPFEHTETSLRTIDELVSNESLSQTNSSINPGYHQILETQTAHSEGEGSLKAVCLKSKQVIGALFDSESQGLLHLSPTNADSVDQPKGDEVLEETGEKFSQVVRNDHLQNGSKLSTEYEEISSNSLVVEEDPECLASKEPHSAGMDRVEKLPSEIEESAPIIDICGKTSTCSPDPACDEIKDTVENPAPVLLLSPKPTNVALSQEPSRATDDGLSGTSCPQKDLSQESTSVKESSDNLKVNSVVLGQHCGEETACGKKLGKVIPVPQVDERPKQRICISEAELEQKKHIYIQCVQAHVKNSMEPTPDALNELYALMNKVASREYQTQDRRWQHPSDLTMSRERTQGGPWPCLSQALCVTAMPHPCVLRALLE
ncbi:S100P-binding protein isoform X2 [Carettochelys insculpta]|uniref:S100P-binding protein isoform X2 n=1 Tax=Carettochelys insculpta TaxID=44489 RepID=UPI003EBF0303